MTSLPSLIARARSEKPYDRLVQELADELEDAIERNAALDALVGYWMEVATGETPDTLSKVLQELYKTSKPSAS